MEELEEHESDASLEELASLKAGVAAVLEDFAAQ